MIINGYNNQIQIDIISLIVILGVIQGLILSIILLQFKNKKSNLYISLFVLFASISISGAFIYKTNLFFLIPHMIRINEPFRFLLAPFFYFYIKSLITINFKFKKKYFLHFIPFILNVIYFIPFYTESAQDKIQYFIDQKYSSNKSNMVLENQVLLILVLISIVIYIIIININIKKHEQNIKENFSSIEKINLLWIKKFSFFFLIIGILLSIIMFFWIFVFTFKEFNRLTPVIVSFTIYVLAYRAIKQPEIFKSNIDTENTDEKTLIEKNKTKKLVISDNKIDEYYDRLINFMKKEKPYLNEELTLPQLAENLKIPIRYLSDVINEKSGFNFYFFINKYRVEEVKELFIRSKDKDISVLDLAFEAGFNSKSTFNAIFKQFTNMTPTEFKKNI